MIRLVALDVYGTMIASDDGDWSFPPRQGLEGFLDECGKRNVIVVTSSDGETQAVKRDLSISFGLVSERGLCIEKFGEFFRLEHPPNSGKDYSVIIGNYDIIPRELLIVDDKSEHVHAALRLGCLAVQCPEYRTNGEREWDFSKIRLE